MRPHSLEVTAFGAFAGTVRVDFDALAAGGLFLLHGETGAGKTTLLDAVGFALYGRVPGQRATAKRLRSDHAAAAPRTSVHLEATVGGRRLRISRSPEQERAKKRGSGTTKEQASVLLEQWDGAAWVALSNRVGEADQEIADRLGMSAEQFFQVILLPQGEFARFLRAPSEERADLLERLFGTEQFRDVEQWLAERRRRTGADLELRIGEIRSAAALVAHIAEVDPPECVPDPVWGTDLLVQSEAGVDTAARALGVASAALATARGSAEATRALAGRQQRRRDALAEREALAEAGALVEAMSVEAAAAAAAAEVAPVLRVGEAASEVVVDAQSAALAALQRSVALGVEDVDPAALRTIGQQQVALRGGLAKLKAVAVAAEAEDVTAARAASAAAVARSDAAAALDRLAALGPQRARLLGEREQAMIAAETLPRLARVADLLADAARVNAELGPAEASCTQLTTRRQQAKDLELERRDVHLTIRQDRVNSMVAELAAKLTEDAPCPVCGSLDHPEVADLSVDRIGPEQEDAAAAAFEEARAIADALASELAAAQAVAEGLQARLAAIGADPALAGLHPTSVGSPQAAKRAKADLATVEATAAALSAVNSTLGSLDAELTSAAQERTVAEERAAAHDREADAARTRAAGHRTELVAALGDCPDLAKALDRAERTAAAANETAAALEALDRAQNAADSADSAATQAAHAAGFPDAAAAQAALREAAWRDRTKTAIAEHRDAVAVLTARLADPDLDVELTRPADVLAADAAVALAAAAHVGAIAAADRAKRQAGELARKVPALSALLADLPHLEDRAATVKALADLTAGQGANTKRMTLSAFVLAARLEEIAAVAGHRLGQMTAGRYSLVHTDTGRGARRGGLGLLARDNWTGVDRDTATLSGGETFLASLALALALADVLSAESGGTRLESLFVDEGFGTLDETTLDEVMDVLDTLREGGRVVGIVSHVAELRQRIPNRLHVRKHETGSDLEVVV